MSRVRNESRWIDKMVRSLQHVCDETLILDDHSTDGTVEICEKLGCKVYRSPFGQIDEARDREVLIGLVGDAGAEIGDWIVQLDGDEEFHSDDIEKLRRVLGNERIVCASVRFLHLWDREDQIRVDGWYSTFRRPSMFRLIRKDLRYPRSGDGANLHASVPAEFLFRQTETDVRVIHRGYMHAADRIRKYQFYNSLDPDNAAEDSYRHTVVGDLFPADSVFKHAGPLQLQQI